MRTAVSWGSEDTHTGLLRSGNFICQGILAKKLDLSGKMINPVEFHNLYMEFQFSFWVLPNLL